MALTNAEALTMSTRRMGRTVPTRRTCALCGQTVRFIGSHVISTHAPAGAGPDAIAAMIAAERSAQ